MLESKHRLATFQEQFSGYLLQADMRASQDLHAWLASGQDPKTCEAQRIDSGLRIYRNNVMYSLTQALAAQFPVVHRLVGAEFFGALARDYVRQEPPLDPALTYYGHLFADFIASSAACRTLPYLADVAALELQCQRALHAADDPILDLVQLGTVPPDALAAAHFTLQASACLFASDYPVDRIWAANLAESDEEIRLEPQSRQHLLIYRRALEVQVVALQEPAFALLQLLQQGSCLQDACDAVQEKYSLDSAAISGLLGYLLGLQVFSRFTLPTTAREHA